MPDNFSVKRKTRLAPIIMKIEVEDVDDDDQDITRTVEFHCIPFLSGDEMLALSSVMDNDIQVGQTQFFDRVLRDDEERKRWRKFLRSANSPDATELVNIAYAMVGKYGNRDDENPTG